MRDRSPPILQIESTGQTCHTLRPSLPPHPGATANTNNSPSCRFYGSAEAMSSGGPQEHHHRKDKGYGTHCMDEETETWDADCEY